MQSRAFHSRYQLNLFFWFAKHALHTISGDNAQAIIKNYTPTTWKLMNEKFGSCWRHIFRHQRIVVQRSTFEIENKECFRVIVLAANRVADGIALWYLANVYLLIARKLFRTNNKALFTIVQRIDLLCGSSALLFEWSSGVFFIRPRNLDDAR